MAYTFHLLGNAHLDPVWSWDWREGLNEGIATCRAILDLMDEDPDLTFIRGESAVYEHVERHDPAAFARIRAYVEAGRWDPVGGMFVQSASDALFGFDMKKGALRATVVRASRYSCDRVVAAEAEPWTPAADAGELRFRFLLAAGDAGLPRMARELEEPVLAVAVPPGGGTLPRSGSLLKLSPASVRIVALRTALDGAGVILSVQSVDNRESSAAITWMGEPIALGSIPAGKIASWRLAPADGHWIASPSSALA